MKRLVPTLKGDGVSMELIMLIRTVLAATKEIAFRVSQGELSGVLGSTLDENIQGEKGIIKQVAQQAGESPEEKHAKAMSIVANAMLNLDEFIMKN